MNATAATSDAPALPLAEPEQAQEGGPSLSLPSGSVGLAHRTSSAVRETRKYTVLLDDAADHAFDRLVDHASGVIGRIRSNTTRRGRQVGRSDIVRALLFLADSNIELRDVMVNQIEAILSEQEGPR